MTNHRPPPPSLRVKYPVSRIMNAIPKQKPEAMIPTMSEPCNASTRGLLRLFQSTSNPHNAKHKPMNRLRFFMRSPITDIVFVFGDLVLLRIFGNCRRYGHG